LLRKALIRAGKTSHTAGTLGAIRSEIIVNVLTKINYMVKYCMDNFFDKLKDFIKFSQNSVSNTEIKNEYLKLVKEFHPDANKNIDFNLANEYMINLNYVYEHLINKKAFVDKFFVYI
jgi:hypothetical protein